MTKRDSLAMQTYGFRHWLSRRIIPKAYGCIDTFYTLLQAVPRPMIVFAEAWFKHTPVSALEIGVASGNDAESILKTLNVQKMLLVDPYKPYFENGELHSFECEYENAVKRLRCYSQAQFIRLTSEEAASEVVGGLDLVYIDGNHAYEHVKQDIHLYYGKVRSGGIIGGHDYVKLNADVVSAVDEFKREVGGDSFHAVFPDWWIIKS